ncbi:EcoAI/FtnUII family type I restriction enzme subunit R [Pelagicoccus sp. SDUM812002]|uniref:EcoAI/FtnUII family type I restriction enzme subunit R n=1 Tax=Pelagicoccus sp. SDUM812002 TaxID=3041266 RepID=UPI00281061E9|nr:DEAD/DEAH box helicase family protein [Pelagicoccus sp. SDUM812002]MDQ8186811.1 DEAD/DEAH box helicase family protein [Pelagicoccus sp. SDUM812002]
MNKKSLSERDICTKFITPSIVAAGWDNASQIREEVGFTDGRIYVRGKLHTRGERKRADYILYYKPNIPLAVVEAKDNKHSVKSGLQQALGYADTLDIPFVFSSNGDAFAFHDKTASGTPIETELSLDSFPSPEALWRKYCLAKNITPEVEPIAAQDYYIDNPKRSPRYYQQIAVNRTVNAIARDEGDNRHLLVMATGTGKTYTAFQIIYRLWKSGLKKRILFLADRTALIDQTARGDFRHFKEAMTVIKHKQIDTAYNIYLALYQGLSDNNDTDAYKQFSPDFFDLVVIDECHRGSARENSKWREILDYFSNASHVGLTATPKETEEVSSSEYFGDPLYTYSLKQGIEDGFLAPYKVVKVTLDIDAEGWRPPAGFKDKDGEEVEDRIYNRTDFDKNIVVEERRQAVAKKITEFLKGSDRFSKTIVFCTDIEHAEGMRAELANANQDLVSQNSKYIMQITGDNAIGKAHLDAFTSPSERYPVIATTSKLMTTGVDAQTCKLIVLDSEIKSMTEFKQIIGRGTRINEDFGKHYFTIMDFRNVTALFADPDFDGDPVRIKATTEQDDISNADTEANDEEIIDDVSGETVDFGDAERPDISILDEEAGDYPRRRKVTVNGIEVMVIKERVMYMGPDGKIITERLLDYTRKNIRNAYASLDDFLTSWKTADRKRAILEELEAKGIFFSALQDEVGADFEPFDLICHVAFEQKPLTRRERANNVRKRDYFSRYGELARTVLDKLLDKYADEGLSDLEDPAVITLRPINSLGTVPEIIKAFGGRDAYDAAVHELATSLYEAS